MLDFRIHTFLCVCRHMNYTKAAAELGITQPAVSQHIRYLEKEYGIKLFNYAGKRLTLTESGQILLDAATTLSNDDTMLKQQLRDLQSNHKSLRFGTTQTIGEFEIIGKLAAYLQKEPEINLYMEIGNTESILKAMDEGKIDFAIVEGVFDQTAYETLVFGVESLVAFCGPEYEASADMSLTELMDKRIIIREEGAGTRMILERVLAEHGLAISNFSYHYEVSSHETIKELAKNNCGIGFLYEAAVRQELANRSLRRIQIKGLDVNHTSTFIWRKGSMYSTLFRHMYDQLKG